MEYVLKTNEISKQYGDKLAVNGVNMIVHKGDIYGLVGENGAGKTTLMRIIAGMALPTTGKLELFESDDLDNARRKVGVLIESPAVFLNMTARENLIYFHILMGLEDLKQIDDVLETVGLHHIGRKKVKNYSLGMKQRLGIAIALLGNPDFLILDEPINGLDISGVKEVRDLLLKINEDFGTTILISSHILSELSRIANRFGIIRGGVLEEEFTAEELKRCSSNCLEMSVSNVELSKQILNGLQGITDIQETSNGMLRIFGDVYLAGNINRRLVENGVDVDRLQPVKEDLESYYLKKNGGQEHDSTTKS